MPKHNMTPEKQSTRFESFVRNEIDQLLEPLCMSFITEPYSGQLDPEDGDRAIPRMVVHDPSIEGTMVHQVLDIGIPDPSGNIRECFITIHWDVLKDRMQCWATDALTGSMHRLDVDTYFFTDNKSLVLGILRHICTLEYPGTLGPRRLDHKKFLTAMCVGDNRFACLMHKDTEVHLVDALNMPSSKLYALTLHLCDTDDDDDVPQEVTLAVIDLSLAGISLEEKFHTYERWSKVFLKGGSLRTVFTKLTGKGLFK